jgi:hypothetical protein
VTIYIGYVRSFGPWWNSREETTKPKVERTTEICDMPNLQRTRHVPSICLDELEHVRGAGYRVSVLLILSCKGLFCVTLLMLTEG